MDRQIASNERGFSLLEVMIAFVLFTLFITAFLTSTGYNVADSTLSEEQLLLQSLCERKINELFLDPPKFENLLSNGLKETKTFPETPFSGYEYTLEIKKLMLPDFAQLMGQKGGTSEEGQESYEGDYFKEEGGSRNSNNAGIEKLVFEEMRKNIEKIVWQARVTVTNKETKQSWALSTYLTNYNEKVQLNVGM